LVTGANGEIGHGLMTRLAGMGRPIVTLDIAPLEPGLARLVRREFTGSITDLGLLERILAEFEIDLVFHLAALLSTRAEFTPVSAHEVNVEGTLNLLEFAHHEGESHGRPVIFLYPSSIAVYGLPDLETKMRAKRVREDEWNTPTTMYGCNKLYCEHLGRYYARHYRQLVRDGVHQAVDFRALRYPGLISAATVPSGGTSDYAAEMIHAAAEGRPYACFVRPDTRIPFMTMPDAIEALLSLAGASEESLSRDVYNVGGFSASAEELADLVREHFPEARITFEPHPQRQGIVDSWPTDVDSTAARRDWGFRARHDLRRAFSEYLVPNITARYPRKSPPAAPRAPAPPRARHRT
jgi:nucleoside-diphosphate-sugar epimerase